MVPVRGFGCKFFHIILIIRKFFFGQLMYLNRQKVFDTLESFSPFLRRAAIDCFAYPQLFAGR